MKLHRVFAPVCCVCLLVIGGWTSARSQTDSTAQLYKLLMVDGSELVGTVVSSAPDTVVFRTGSGMTMTIPRTSIKELRPASGEYVGGEYRRYDPNASRLLIGPTGRPLKKGQGYFAAYEIFFTYFGFGITDNISLGGGITLLPGAEGQLFYIAPKVGISTVSENISLSLGGIYMNTTADDVGGLGAIFAMGTFGPPTASFTAGLGYGYAEGEFSGSPLLVFGGEVQLSGSVKLLSENYVPVGADAVILSFGIRFFGERLSADLGFFYPMSGGEGIDEGFPLIPWLGFAYNFGN
jgi:hypothetical protein